MQVINVDDMKTKESEDGKEVTLFRDIGESLGIIPVRLVYKPVDMELTDYSIDTEQRRAFVFYKYDNEIIRYAVYENDSDSSLGQKEEDILTDTFIISVSEHDIEIKEYDVGNGKGKRYIANFSNKGCQYQLKGVMEKEEFIKIIKKLKFI